MIEMKTLYDLLKTVESVDVWDQHYDDVMCWELCDDDDDPCFRCATEMAKNIEVISYKDQYNGVADIGGFVKKHMPFLYELSQGFRWPMPDADPDNDESVLRGVQIVNAMQAGYACDEDYEAMLKELGVQ